MSINKLSKYKPIGEPFTGEISVIWINQFRQYDGKSDRKKSCDNSDKRI